MLKAVDIVYKTISFFFLIKYSTQHIFKKITTASTTDSGLVTPQFLASKNFKEEGGLIKGLSSLDIY